MEGLLDLLKILIPAVLVLYAMFLTIRTMLNKELEKARIELKQRSIEATLPIRLQAYERITLLLERLSPNNLILRLNQGNLSSKELQSIMLKEIRDEYNHNVSQQVYMSDAVWELVKNAKEDLIITINTAADKMAEDATSMDLAKQIFEEMINKEVDPMAHALHEVKDEIRQSF